MSNNSFRFTSFNVYKNSKDFHHRIVLLTLKFPRNYWYLADQLKRSALSVILNIAEGSAKKSDAHFNRYLKISLGSINETVASLEICVEEKLLEQTDFDNLIAEATSIANQLGGFSKSLKGF